LRFVVSVADMMGVYAGRPRTLRSGQAAAVYPLGRLASNQGAGSLAPLLPAARLP
jgi:hypothetical protein